MTCAILTDDRVKCWGSGSLGSLGNGSNKGAGSNASEMGDALPFLDLGTNPSTSAPWKGQLGTEDNQNRGDQPGQMGDSLPLIQLR